MEQVLFKVVYIITNIIRTYCIYRLMNVFLPKRKEGTVKAIIYYILFYCIITVCFLFVHIPLLMLSCNIVGLCLLSLYYDTNLKKRIVSISLIAIILMLVEAIITSVIGYINIPFFRSEYYPSIWGLICNQIILFAITQVLKKFQNIKAGENIPVFYWVCIVTIPAVSLFLSVILLYTDGLSIIQVVISQLCLLWINVTMFVLYDGFISSFNEREETKLLIQQNHYYMQQFEIMKETENTLRSMKHDWINHLSTMKELLNIGETNSLNQYILNTEDFVIQSFRSIHSGNVIIDSILNCKKREAEQKSIPIYISASLPNELEIDALDLTIVLGNLIDNAIQASCSLEINDKKIDINLQYDVGMLIIEVKNNYDGITKYENGELCTIKIEKAQHGFGLKNIQRVVEKNNGFLKIKHDENVFQVIVMLLEKQNNVVCY